VKLWHERMRAYKKLIHWTSGNTRNGSNIIRSTMKNGIPNSRELSLARMEQAVDFANAQNRLLRGKAPKLRKEDLRECLLKAEPSNDKART